MSRPHAQPTGPRTQGMRPPAGAPPRGDGEGDFPKGRARDPSSRARPNLATDHDRTRP